jgi:hypothetical protein
MAKRRGAKARKGSRRRSGAGGVLMGMRRGVRRAAGQQRGGRRSWVGVVVTAVLVLAALALALGRM